jgi:GcrA cell cycle regulator
MSADGGDILQSGWTAERVAALVEHYRTGLSAAESAALIGGVSKNAVVSKRRRLGLLASVAMGARSAAGRGFPRLTGLGRIRRLRCPPLLPTSPLPKMDGPRPPGANPKRLVERGFGDCAWPLGPAHEPGDYRTLFCGAPTLGCGRYCEAHAARAYRPCEV